MTRTDPRRLEVDCDGALACRRAYDSDLQVSQPIRQISALPASSLGLRRAIAKPAEVPWRRATLPVAHRGDAGFATGEPRTDVS